MKKGRRTFKLLVVKPTGKRPRRKLEDYTSIRIYIKEIGLNTRNCVVTAQDRNYYRSLVNAALKLRVP